MIPRLDLLVALASLFSAVAMALVVGAVVRPTGRLAGRVRPYTVSARTRLGRSADPSVIARPGPALAGGTLKRLFGPPVEALARKLSSYVDSSGEEALRRKLRQARLLTDVPESQRVTEYRVRQLGAAAGAASAGIAVGLFLRGGASIVLVLGIAGFIVGVTRWRGRMDRAIEDRRTRMRIELYTVNQLLAMHVRVGGGVIQAVRRIVQRGRGEVVDELLDVLRAHESGVPTSEALLRAAELTPEPYAARTYRILAVGAEHGADLGTALLAHSEEVREARREAIRRAATRRRAAMLVPIIAVLAPVMLLFIAAPLPSLVFGVR